MVHHLDAVRDGGALLPSEARLLTLCNSCHSELHKGTLDQERLEYRASLGRIASSV